MNIFATDPCPVQSAIWLDDVRKNKMILESAQLLSSACKINGLGEYWDVYKITHSGHPCAHWARQSRANFVWLLDHMKALAGSREHKSMLLVPEFERYVAQGYFPIEEHTPFANCAANQSLGLSFKHISDTHEAYRLYLNERWKRDTISLSWNRGEKPEWSTYERPYYEME